MTVPPNATPPQEGQPPPDPLNQPGATLHLARLAREGDADGWDQLDRRLRPWLVARLGGRRLAMGWTPEDVVNATFAEAYYDLEKFEPRGPGSFRAWLWTIAKRLITDLARREDAAKRRSGPLVDLQGNSTTGGPPLDVQDDRNARASMLVRCNELSAAFRAALTELDAEKRTVVELHLLEELPFEAIAPRIGRDKAVTVRAIYSRAMAQIRTRLERHR